jgi:hypothetical protein
MRAVETQDPISPRRINPAIAVDLETIVFKAIAKDKDDRYTTAGEMADDLRRFLEGRSTLARRPTAVDLAFKWAIRRRSVVLASLLVLVSVVIGLTGSMMIISRHSGEKDLALVRAEHHLQQAHSAVDRFGRLYADKLTGLPATETLRRDVLREAERYYVDFIGYAESDPLLRQEMATVRFRLGGVLADLGDPNGAIESYENAIADLQKLRLQLPRDSKLISDLAACLHNLAKRFKDLGDFENAVQAYRQAAAYQQTAMRENLADSAITQWSATQTNLALLLIESGDSADAMKLLEETLAELEIEAKRDSANAMVVLQRSETRNALVAILLKNDPLRAEDLLSQSITELEKLSAESIQRGETREDLAFRTVCQLSTARNNLATLLGRRNKTSEAIQLTAEAIAELEAATKAFPSDQTIGQQMAIALNNHGQLLFDSGQVREADVSFANAEKMFRQVVSARPELPQPKSRLAGVLHNRGVVRAANGDFAQAAELLQDAISFQLAAIEESSFSLQYHQYLAAHRELLADVLHQENPSAQSAELGSAAGKLQTELLDESE